MKLMELDPECVEYLEKRYSEAENILKNKEYSNLKNFPRHHFTNTYDHSVRVACGVVWLAEKWGIDTESAVKVGLLHDMCFVDYYQDHNNPKELRHKGLYAFYHPVEAVENAKRVFGLNKTEEKAIKSHMFPLAIHMPTSKLAWALTLSDKAVAAYEGLYGIRMFNKAAAMIGARVALAVMI